MDRSQKAVEYKHNANNCCQAVILAFAEEMGLTTEQIRKLGAAFGSGMGRLDGTCGALVGAEMALGMIKYEGKPMHAQAKELFSEFEALCGSTVCRSIKGTDDGKPLCSCDECVANAVKILEKIIEE